MKQGDGIKVVMISCAIAAIALNIIVFAVPFIHGAVFWLSYLFLWIGIAVVAGSNLYLYHRAMTTKSGLYRTSIVATGLIYLMAVCIACLVFMMQPLTPLWIEIVVQTAMLAVCLLMMLGGGAGAGLVDRDEQRTAQSTAMMESIKQQAENAVTFASTPDAKREAAALAEALKYSDPVSTPASLAYEQQIMGIVSQISGRTASGDLAGTKSLCAQARNLLERRNAVCLSSKQR